MCPLGGMNLGGRVSLDRVRLVELIIKDATEGKQTKGGYTAEVLGFQSANSGDSCLSPGRGTGWE